MTEQVPGYDARTSQPERANQSERTAETADWSAEAIRALRTRLGDSQERFAERLGTRQQTVSEWERGASTPRRMARRLLHMVAEEHGVYTVGGGPRGDVGGGEPAAADAEARS